MPSPSHNRFTSNSSYRHPLSWDFKLNPATATWEPLPADNDMPVGAWQVSVGRHGNEFILHASCSQFTPEVDLEKAQATSELRWRGKDGSGTIGSSQIVKLGKGGANGVRNDGAAAPWTSTSFTIFHRVPLTAFEAAEAASTLFNFSSHRRYRFKITYEQGSSQPAPPKMGPSTNSLTAVKLAKRLQDVHRSRFPNDVRFFFPGARPGGADLWAPSPVLLRSSPYLKDLLTSDFAEGRRRTSTAEFEVATEGSSQTEPERDFNDSDDEADAVLFAKRPPEREDAANVESAPYQQINVTQTAYSTYKAVLLYLETDYIRFFPLASSRPPADPTVFTAHADADPRPNRLSGDPHLPLAVSPKSTYRLAHFLQLEDLQKRCLTAFASSLKEDGAAAELFSDTSTRYDAVRKVVLDYVVRNWEEVQKRESWKAMLKRQQDEETEGAARVLVELLQAVALK
ncbi:hypothetical protein JCM6882_002897 [Rhodosporidiobolus microsporus]